MEDFGLYVIKSLADWVRSWNAEISDVPKLDSGGVLLHWYLSPEQHVVEWIAAHAVLVPIMLFLLKFNWPVDVPKALPVASSQDVWAGKAKDSSLGANDAKAPAPSGWLLNAVEWMLRLLCFGHCAATIYYKLSTGRAVYLLQPCHLSNYVLCYLCFDDSLFGGKVFYFYINFWYGTLLALAAPDLRGLHLPGETFNFFSQHIMLFALPAVWIIKRRYAMYKGFWLSILMWAMAFTMHFDLLWPMSILGFGNLNYMLVPPSVYPMALYPQYFRPIVGLFCILLTVFSRYILAEVIIVLSGIRTQAQQEASGAPAQVPQKMSVKSVELQDSPKAAVEAPVSSSSKQASSTRKRNPQRSDA